MTSEVPYNTSVRLVSDRQHGSGHHHPSEPATATGTCHHHHQNLPLPSSEPATAFHPTLPPTETFSIDKGLAVGVWEIGLCLKFFFFFKNIQINKIYQLFLA